MSEMNELLNELQSQEWWVRNNAMKRLLQQPEESYLPFLEAGLRNHENATLRNAAMEFFIALGGRALMSLIRLSSDEDTDVRIFVANVLGDIRDRGAVPALVVRLHDPDVNVRMASAEALGKIGDREAVEGLRVSLEDEPWVAMAAIKSLGDIGGEEALTILYDCSAREEYRGMVFEAVERAGDCKSIPFLLSYVDRDELWDVALKAMVNIILRRRCSISSEVLAEMIPLLLELQASPQPELKRAALIALSWSQDIRSLPFLIDALSNEELQEFAINGIMVMGEKALPGVFAALRQGERPQRGILAKMVSMLGGGTTLIEFAGDDDPDVRVEVAIAISSLHSPETNEILSRMLEDPEEEVRLAASRGLEVSID